MTSEYLIYRFPRHGILIILSLSFLVFGPSHLRAETVATQNVTIDLAKLIGQPWIEQAAHLLHGSLTPFSPKSHVIVVIDSAGHHVISSTPGNPTAVTLTKRRLLQLAAKDDSVDAKSLASMPDSYGWCISVNSAHQVVVTTTTTTAGHSTHGVYVVAQILAHQQKRHAHDNAALTYLQSIPSLLPPGSINIGTARRLPGHQGAS